MELTRSTDHGRHRRDRTRGSGGEPVARTDRRGDGHLRRGLRRHGRPRRGRPGGRDPQRHRPAARLGELRPDDRRTSRRSTASTVESDQPDADSQEEIDALKNLAGTDAAPDVLDLAPTVALANTDLYAPYRSRHGPTSPTTSRRPAASGSATTPASCPSGATSGRVALPATVADLLKPEYAGMVALNGNPTSAGAGFNGVVMASLANGGSADDIAPGVEFFKQLNEAGNLLPVDPTPGDDRLRADAVRHRLGVHQRRPDRRARRPGSTGRSSSRAMPRRSRPTTSRPSTRRRRIRRPPDSGRSTSSRPRGRTPGSRASRDPSCRTSSSPTARSTRRRSARSRTASGTPVQLTQEQIAAAQEYLAANWDITIE